VEGGAAGPYQPLGIEGWVQLRQAGRTEAVGEVRLGVPGDVGLELDPAAVVASNLLARRANRQQAAQDLEARERGFFAREIALDSAKMEILSSSAASMTR